MTTTEQITRTERAMRVAGRPVRFTWVEFQAPGVSYGGMEREQRGYWLCDVVSGGVVMSASGPVYSRPWKVDFIPFEEITEMEAWEAALVAERAAESALSDVAQPVGEIRVPSDSEMVNAVLKARDYRLQAWAWKVVAECLRYGETVSGKAREILRLDG